MSTTMTETIAAQSNGAAEKSPGDPTARSSMSKAEVEITNRRYQPDPFWGGPKGIEYGLLVGALPIQEPPLYPDGDATYFVAQIHLPAGSRLTLRGTFPHGRYLSFTIANQLPNRQLGGGDHLRDDEIVPDEGSSNPFLGASAPFQPSASRRVTPRSYTVHIHEGEAPAERAVNTIYTGTRRPDAGIHLAMRNYVADAGYDGTGVVPLAGAEGYGLPSVTLRLADGTELTGEKMCEVLRASKARDKNSYTVDEWLTKVKESGDPENAPIGPVPVFQRFWNIDYSVNGSFISNPLERVLRCPANDDGGFANNPDTVYVMAGFSLAYGRVVVIQGKMPTHQKTRHHEERWTPDTDVRYWSITSGGSAPSGVGWMSLYDEEIPLDADGNYTIVMSWPEDRPANATRENGVAWLDFGGGEGHYIGARSWVNTVYMRFQVSNPDWPQAPTQIPAPTPEHPIPQDEKVMGDYYPRARYTSKKDFEDGFPGPSPRRR